MVINHTDSLQKGIHNCRTYKSKSPFFQVLTDLFRQRCHGRHIRLSLPMTDYARSIGVRPNISIKRTELSLDLLKSHSIFSKRCYLKSITNNIRILQKFSFFDRRSLLHRSGVPLFL